jgi:hypothetical protein
MEATSSSEMSVEFQRVTWRYIPENKTLIDCYFWTTMYNMYKKSKDLTFHIAKMNYRRLCFLKVGKYGG